MKVLMTKALVFSCAIVAVVVTSTAVVLLYWSAANAAETADRQDVAALSAVVAVTTDADSIRAALSRTTAGGEGRLAVHLTSGLTIGPGRATAADVLAAVNGRTPLSWRVLPGRAVIELSRPAEVDVSRFLWLAVVLGAAGSLAVTVSVLTGRRMVAPVLTCLGVLTGAARDGRTRIRLRGPAELEALADAVNSAAERNDRMRAAERDMIADVSHRLRTPLTALRLDVDALDDGEVSNRIRGAVAVLDRDVSRIIESSRSFASAESHCDLVAVLRARMEFWAARAADQQRSCEVETPARVLRVEISPEVLAAAVDTVLDNVFRYTPPGSAMAVEVVSHAGWATLVVEDGGSGVPPSQDVAARWHSGGGSTGLGLAIARAAAESAGGALHVERGRLGGARIRMRFAEAEGERGVESRSPLAWRLWRSRTSATQVKHL